MQMYKLKNSNNPLKEFTMYGRIEFVIPRCWRAQRWSHSASFFPVFLFTIIILARIFPFLWYSSFLYLFRFLKQLKKLKHIPEPISLNTDLNLSNNFHVSTIYFRYKNKPHVEMSGSHIRSLAEMDKTK